MSMSEAQFANTLKNWIFHKLILSQKSTVYQEDKKKKNAARIIRERFTNFLQYPNNYSVGQLAIMIKRNEEFFNAMLPIPQNQTFENSLITLNNLLQQATEIIKHYNL